MDCETSSPEQEEEEEEMSLDVCKHPEKQQG